MKTRTIVFDLPLPPHDAALGDANYRDWLAEAGGAIAKTKCEQILGPVAVKAFVSLSHERPDLEKVANRVIDILVVNNVIEDRGISDLTMRLDRAITNGRVHVEVKSAKPPERRQSAEGRAIISRAVRKRWADAKAQKTASAAVA